MRKPDWDEYWDFDRFDALWIIFWVVVVLLISARGILDFTMGQLL